MFREKLKIDDAIFNRNWAGARRGRWAGPGLLVGWGCRLLDRRGWGRTAAAMLDCRLWVWHFSAKTRKMGSTRASPVTALIQLLSERKERLLRGGEYVSYGDVSQNLRTFHRWGGLVFIVDVQLVGR